MVLVVVFTREEKEAVFIRDAITTEEEVFTRE